MLENFENLFGVDVYALLVLKGFHLSMVRMYSSWPPCALIWSFEAERLPKNFLIIIALTCFVPLVNNLTKFSCFWATMVFHPSLCFSESFAAV